MTYRDRAPPITVTRDDGAIGVWATEGDGPAILLLHGWSLDHRIWLPQMEDPALAGHHLVAIDRRGFGLSSAPPDLDREVADIGAVLDRLGIGRAILVGQSQAGRVALQLALRQPGRVAGLVLVGAPIAGFHPFPRPEEDVPVDLYRRLVAEGRLDEMKRLWARHPMMEQGAGDHPLLVAMLDDYDARDLRAAPPPPGADIRQIAAIPAPALVVTGERDTAWRRLAGDAIAYGLRHGRRADIPGAGHLCNLDAPADFNRLLRDFAGSIEAA